MGCTGKHLILLQLAEFWDKVLLWNGIDYSVYMVCFLFFIYVLLGLRIRTSFIFFRQHLFIGNLNNLGEIWSHLYVAFLSV